MQATVRLLYSELWNWCIILAYTVSVFCLNAEYVRKFTKVLQNKEIVDVFQPSAFWRKESRPPIVFISVFGRSRRDQYLEN